MEQTGTETKKADPCGGGEANAVAFRRRPARHVGQSEVTVTSATPPCSAN